MGRRILTALALCVVAVEAAVAARADNGMPEAAGRALKTYSSDTIILEDDNDFDQDDSTKELGFRLHTRNGAKAEAQYADHHTDPHEETGNYWARVKIIKPTSTDWHIQLKNPKYVLKPHRTYKVSARVRASVDKAPFVIDFLTNKGYDVLAEKHFIASKNWETYSMSYTTSDSVKVINTIDLGGVPAGTYWDIDDIVITENNDKSATDSNSFSSAYRMADHLETAQDIKVAASTRFEAGQPNPYSYHVLAPAVGHMVMDSTTLPLHGSHSAAISIDTPSPAGPWKVQLRSSMFDVKKGYKYTVMARMFATKPRVPVDFSVNSGPPGYYTLKGSAKTVYVDDYYKMHRFEFEAEHDGTYRVHFDFGKAPAGTLIFMDDIQAFASRA